MTTEDKKLALVRRGFKVGPRDPRINRRHAGKFMVVEAHEESELPTEDGCHGPWCIVGDNLDRLVDEAYGIWREAYAHEASPGHCPS